MKSPEFKGSRQSSATLCGRCCHDFIDLLCAAWLNVSERGGGGTMISLTRPNGVKVEVYEAGVLRIRKSMLYADQTLPHDPAALGKTRVDADQMILVQEEPGLVAAMVLPGLSTLVQFTMPDGSPIWINAKKAVGPVFVASTNLTNGVRSALTLASQYQFLANTPEEVHERILRAGGDARPVRPNMLFAASMTMLRRWFNPMKNWDAPTDKE